MSDRGKSDSEKRTQGSTRLGSPDLGSFTGRWGLGGVGAHAGRPRASTTLVIHETATDLWSRLFGRHD